MLWKPSGSNDFSLCVSPIMLPSNTVLDFRQHSKYWIYLAKINHTSIVVKNKLHAITYCYASKAWLEHLQPLSKCQQNKALLFKSEPLRLAQNFSSSKHVGSSSSLKLVSFWRDGKTRHQKASASRYEKSVYYQKLITFMFCVMQI